MKADDLLWRTIRAVEKRDMPTLNVSYNSAEYIRAAMKVDNMFPCEAEGWDSYYPCDYHIDFHVGVFEILLSAFISVYTEMSRFPTSYGATHRLFSTLFSVL